MPKVSVNILTKNRSQSLLKALFSVAAQSYEDYEIIVVNDGSTDNTLQALKGMNVKIVTHTTSLGITASRQHALEVSQGEYIAVLDDDDEWTDQDKLKKQMEFLDSHQDYVLVGGAIETKKRPETDGQIRKSMLFRNNFFTSTVMFRRSSALLAGGFIKDEDDLAEDYDLWLRLGKLGKMYNFQSIFTRYAVSLYNKLKFKVFLAKQLRLINREKQNYPYYLLASLILRFRLIF